MTNQRTYYFETNSWFKSLVWVLFFVWHRAVEVLDIVVVPIAVVTVVVVAVVVVVPQHTMVADDSKVASVIGVDQEQDSDAAFC